MSFSFIFPVQSYLSAYDPYFSDSFATRFKAVRLVKKTITTKVEKALNLRMFFSCEKLLQNTEQMQLMINWYYGPQCMVRKNNIV